MVKLIIIAVVILAILGLISYVALTALNRVKPVPPVRELEEARRILIDIQIKDEALAMLPESTRRKVDEYLQDN